MKKKNPDIIELSNSSSTTTYLADGTRGIKQLLAPSSVVLTSEDEIKVENNYAQSYVINGYPTNLVIGWADDIYRYPGDIDVVQHITPINERLSLDEITNKITQYEAQFQVETQKGSIKNITNLQSILSTLYEQRARLEQNIESMFHINMAYTIYNKSSRDLNKQAQMLQSKLVGKKIGIMPLHLRQDEGIHTTSPFGLDYVPDFNRNINTGALTTMFPFYCPEATHPSGIFMGINTALQTPIFIDFFNKKLLNNANLCLFGASGAGKSYMSSIIVSRTLLNMEKTLIIDPEGEYTRITQEVNGALFKIAPSSQSNQLSMNPMDIDIEVELDDNGEPTGYEFVNLKSKTADLLSLLSTMLPSMMSDEIMAALSDIIMGVYYSFGFTENPNSLYMESDLFDEATETYYHDKIIKVMPRFSDLRKAMYDYAEANGDGYMLSFANAFGLFCEGGAYDLFDCYTTVNVDLKNTPIITFNIAGIEDEILRPIAMQVVLSWAWSKFICKDIKSKKRILCDEAWMMLSSSMAGNKYTALFLEKCARRIRKYNGSLFCASQNFREFISRPEGLSILSNSGVKCFLQLTPEDLDATVDKFKLTEGEMDFLSNATQGRVLMKMGKESILLNVFSFPFEDKMISKEFLKKE